MAGRRAARTAVTGPIRLALEGPIARITLDRPDRHNVLGIGDLPAFHDALDRVVAHDARVLVLTGAGTKAFCAGIDLGDILATDWRDNPVEALIDRVAAFAVPTIAALNGLAFGAAGDLALACDLRIGVAGMRLGMPPARLGVVLHESGLRRFATRLSANAARRLLLGDEVLEADELWRAGYLDRVVPAEALAATTKSLAETIAGLAPRAVRAMKRALGEIERGELDAGWLKSETLACFASEDVKEGLRAFAAKRRPTFTGR